MESKTLVSAILVKMSNVSKWQRTFIIHLIPLFMIIKRRINFIQMFRYGYFSDMTYRNNFEKSFDFGQFNGEHIKQKGAGHHVILFDPSHIRKSGKHTFGKGRFWSGYDSSMKQGLEIGGIAVGDVEHHTAFHYECIKKCGAITIKFFTYLLRLSIERLIFYLRSPTNICPTHFDALRDMECIKKCGAIDF